MKNKYKALLITHSKNNNGVQGLRLNAYKKYFDIFICNYKGNIFKWYKLANDLLKYLNYEPFKCIIAEDIFISGLIGVRLKKKYGIPLYIRCGGEWTYENKVKNYIAKQIKKYVIKNCDLLIVNSNYLKNKIGGKVYINGVDTKKFKPQSNNKYIGYFGRMEESKGVQYLPNTIGLLYKENFILCGSGSLYKKIHKQKSVNTHLFSKFNHKHVADYMRFCKYIIVPTLKHSCDSMPNVILEAMASGCIVICTDTQQNKQLIKHRVNGLIIKQRSRLQIVYAINYLNNNPDLVKKLKKNALKDVKTKYSLTNYNKMAERMYKEVIFNIK